MLSKPRITKWVNDLKFYFRSKTNKTLLNQNNGLLLHNKNWANHYFAWKLSSQHNEVLKYIKNAYQQHLKKEIYPDILILDIPQSTGFSIMFGKNFHHRDAPYIFEYLKEASLQQLGSYYLAHYSSEEQTDKSVLYRYYLKPQYGFNEQQQQIQQYGNIMIDLIIRKNRAKYIKLVRNLYSGRNYEEVYDFNNLISTITRVK